MEKNQLENTVESFKYVVDAWRDHLKSDPNAFALTDMSGHTYSRLEVDDLSDRIHAFLMKHDIGKDDVVLIHLERSARSVIAVLGVAKTGAAFVLVESGAAAERVNYIRWDCSTKFELNEENWSEAVSCEPEREYAVPDDHDLAVCVYTSGTGGAPKGVMHEYGQLKLEMISEMREDGTWRETVQTRWGLISPLNFVASLKIIVHFLYCGGHLYVIDYDTARNPFKLNAFLLMHRVNEMFPSPSFLRLSGDETGPFMQCIYTGAEPANNIALKNCELVNTYTMSESFFTISEFVITRPYDVVPIGKPLFALDIRLVDEARNTAADGETGEICFYNPYCRGYINCEAENRMHFTDGYFYTGDLAVYRDGQLILKGRNDDMVKINGNRIEPAEIEAACKKAFGLTWCAARGFEEEATVALYYTDKVTIDGVQARAKLERVLPYYMIPSYFIQIDDVPLTASGKMDRNALKLPACALLEAYAAPRNEFERTLTEAMAEVLGLERIGIKDDFFLLGGNSIRAMEVLAKVGMDDLNAKLIYKGRTVENISELYAAEGSSKMSDEEKEMICQARRSPLSPMQKWMWLEANGIHDFVAAYRLSPMVSIEKLRDALNAYACLNSSFNVAIEDDNGEPVQVYNPETPRYEIETMTEEEVKELQKTFVGPFEYGEPLIRIRLIRTGLHKYLFFQIAHLITDGAGVRLFVQDISTLYNGGGIRPAYYFAYAYDCAIPVPDDMMKDASEYYRQKLNPAARMRYLIKEETGQFGQGITKDISFPLGKVDRLVSKYDSTPAGFINLLVCLAMEQYNGKPSYLENILDNRSPNENIAGLRFTTGAIGIMTPNRSLSELFQDINEQMNQTIRYSYYNFDSEAAQEDDYKSLGTSYIMDWFSSGSGIRSLGKQLSLENRHVKREVRPGVIVQVRHEDGQMVFQFHYDRKYLSDEHANDFMSLLKNTGDELLNGKVEELFHGRN